MEQKNKPGDNFVEERLPSISVVTVTLNCENALRECYSRLVTQDYPKKALELIVVDGGSTDQTSEVALRFGAKFINGGYKDNQEARRYFGVKEARNEIILILDSDNYIIQKDLLKRMVEPFRDPRIVASQPLRYSYVKTETLMNRYFALLGVNDPVAFYLGKSDRLSYLYERWNNGGTIVNEDDRYYEVEFSPHDLPTVGSNGFFIRRQAINSLKLKPEEFFHIDINYDLVCRGLNHFAIVKIDILHSTSTTFMRNMLKRLAYMDVHHRKLESLRRYKVFDSRRRRDRLNLLKFIILALTVVGPLLISVRGYFRVRDRAWFLHPLVCLGFMVMYSGAVLKNFKRG